MKKGWEYSTIGDLCDKMNGLWKGKKEPFVNVGVIRNANFTKSFTLSFDNIEYLDVEAKQYKTRKLQKGDLIVEKSGGSEKQPVGRTVLFDKEDSEYSFSNFTSVLRIKDREIISPEFLFKYILFLYLRGDTRKMQKATTGIHNIEFDKFLSILVPVLSLSEQQSIVDYLDSAFAKIDAMKANAEKALNEAKALFQASLKEMFEPKEGWTYSTIGDLCDKINGLWKGKVGPFVNVGVIRNANFTKSFTLSFDNIEYLDVEAKQYKTRKLQKGDLIVEKSGGSEKQPVGRTVLFDKEEGEYSFSNFTSVLRIKDRSIISPEFLFKYILFVYLRGDTRKMQKATTGIHNIEFDKFLSIPVPKLTLSEQHSIVYYLDTLGAKVSLLQENYDKISQECDALKQAILREVFE